MNTKVKDKLTSILEYYKETYQVENELSEVLDELMTNNVEVDGDSFFCPIWNEDINGWVLLAGTKDKADMWVLKKILKLIKSGDIVYTVLNGNSDNIIKMASKYNINVISKTGDMVYISFNTKTKEN